MSAGGRLAFERDRTVHVVPRDLGHLKDVAAFEAPDLAWLGCYGPAVSHNTAA